MANFNFNRVMLGGRLTADPENKQTTDGTSVTSFTVAVNRKGTTADGKAVADFFKVTAWRQTADFVAKFFRRGSAIFVVGVIRNRSYVDHEGTKRYVTEIVADEVSFVDSRSENTSGTDGASVEKPAPFASGFASSEDFMEISTDDDLPF